MEQKEIISMLENNLITGKPVTITNEAHDDMTPNKIQINFAGTLEKTDDTYYVRVGEDNYAGAMGIGFSPSNVVEVVVRPSNRELIIILK